MPNEQGIATARFLLVLLFLFIAESLFSYVIASGSEIAQPATLYTQPTKQLKAEEVITPRQSLKLDSKSILSTSYKKYSLCKYGDNYILCEPYTVQKGDWVYKIFRTKGELSKEDFGLFIRIFKEINPDIKNMNTIKPGELITIPLKKSKKNDFKETLPGVVELPTITLSKLPKLPNSPDKPETEKSSSTDNSDISDNFDISNNLAISGKTYSTNIDSTPISTALSDKPTETENKLLPKSVESKTNISTTVKKTSSKIPIKKLKKFALLNSGQLMLKGKYYFPRDNSDDLVIDVALTPLIQLQNGSRILFVPDRDAFANVINTIKSFWHNFKIIEFKEVSQSFVDESNYLSKSDLILSNDPKNSKEQLLSIEPQEDAYVPINVTIEQEHKTAVKQLLEISGYKYTPEKEITITVGNISIKATPGIINREGKSDIIVVFGDIYGSAFEALKKMKQGDIITVSPLLTTIDLARKLFSALGASTTNNPAFINPTDHKAISTDGIYIKDENTELFITQKPALLKDIFRYLNDRNIKIIRVDNSI